MKQEMSSSEYRALIGAQKKPMKSMSGREWQEAMKKKKPSSKGSNDIRIMLQLAKIQFVEEHRFHPDRKWRFDFAIPDQKIAIEYEGIHSGKSRHTTRGGYAGDVEKYREAAKLGWTVLRYTAKDYKGVVDDILATIQNKV
jgi:very-short-patch-repair endonuclease